MSEPDRALLIAVRRRARAVDEAIAERDRAIRRAAQAGFTLRQIAAEAGLSHQRIGQITARDPARAA